MRVRVSVLMTFMAMLVIKIVFMVTAEMDVEFCSGDLRLLRAGDVQVPAVKLHFFQFGLQLFGANAEVNEGADEHVATDAAEDVEIQGFHLHYLPAGETRALI